MGGVARKSKVGGFSEDFLAGRANLLAEGARAQPRNSRGVFPAQREQDGLFGDDSAVQGEGGEGEDVHAAPEKGDDAEVSGEGGKVRRGGVGEGDGERVPGLRGELAAHVDEEGEAERIGVAAVGEGLVGDAIGEGAGGGVLLEGGHHPVIRCVAGAAGLLALLSLNPPRPGGPSRRGGWGPPARGRPGRGALEGEVDASAFAHPTGASQLMRCA